MLRAVIRSQGNALHFGGELNGYNLESVHEFVRQRRRDNGGVRLLLQIDREDGEEFAACAPRWLHRFAGAGAHVEVRVRGVR